MADGKTYVHQNEHGCLKVGVSDVSLDSVVVGYHDGLSAETIQQHYPSLTLEEVYGAIAFYLANQQEVEDYLRRQDAVWDDLRKHVDANPSPVVIRLRALAASRAARVMTRPRFLADHDIDHAIISGVLRREPDVEFRRAREFGLDQCSDDAVLAFAAEQQWIIVSHDVNTMTAAAFRRLATGEPMCGLLMVRQQWAIRPTIDSLLFIWSESQAEEWRGTVLYLPL